MAKLNRNGLVLWQGASLLDGAPIAVIAVGLEESNNRKTGAMLQTFVIRTDMAPNVAIATGADAAVCGNCKHRPSTGGACYVQSYSVCSVYRCFARGGYRHAAPAELADIGAGRAVRIGTYGDPAAAPAYVWHTLVQRAAMHTGYSHQWGTGAGSAPLIRSIVMASADTPQEAIAAQSAGWRTFRVNLDGVKGKGEAVCPASQEAGYKLTCNQCGMCNGSGTGRKGSITIKVHGPLARRFADVVSRIA